MWSIFFVQNMTGCGKKLPNTLSNPTEVEHPECAHGSHYYAVGIAANSEDAVLKSQTAISSQIQSSIQSELQVETQSVDQQSKTQGNFGRTKHSGTYLEETKILDTSMARSNFAFADLITIVQGPIEYKDQYYVLSCLNKRNASKRISETLQSDIDELKGLYTIAQKAIEEQQKSSFSTSYSQFMSLYDTLVPTFYVLRSLSKRSSIESEVYPLRQELESKAQNIRAQSIFALRMTTTDTSSENQSGLVHIRTGMQASLKEIGLNSISTTTYCEKQNSFDMEIKMTPIYQKGPMGGWIFAPQLEVVITECALPDQPQNIFAITNKNFQAYNSRDKNLAYQDLIQKASQPIFIDDLKEHLQMLLPL